MIKQASSQLGADRQWDLFGQSLRCRLRWYEGDWQSGLLQDLQRRSSGRTMQRSGLIAKVYHNLTATGKVPTTFACTLWLPSSRAHPYFRRVAYEKPC
eukprot:3344768-Pleurochrysis_carterae.AAC.2